LSIQHTAAIEHAAHFKCLVWSSTAIEQAKSTSAGDVQFTQACHKSIQARKLLKRLIRKSLQKCFF